MRLSVVIPFYREIDLVSRAVESVAQNAEAVDELRILICNDGPFSESDVRARLSERGGEYTTIVKNAGPLGPGGARNAGLDLAQGELIAFLDADDYWLPGKLAAQIAKVRAGATFVATAYKFEKSEVIIQPPRSISEEPLDVFLKRGLGTSTILITRELLGSRRFRDIRFSQDIDFWHRLTKSPDFTYSSINTPTAVYSTGGSTKNKWVQLRYFNKVLCMNDISFPQRCRVLSSYVFAGILNHYIRPMLRSARK